MPETEPSPRQLTLPGVEAAREAGAAPASGLGTSVEGLSDDERACWVAFTRVRGIGPMRFGKLDVKRDYV